MGKHILGFISQALKLPAYLSSIIFSYKCKICNYSFKILISLENYWHLRKMIKQADLSLKDENDEIY